MIYFTYNHVHFFFRRNIIDSIDNETYLQTCRYNASDPLDQFCPIFKIGTIIKEAGEDMSIAVKVGHYLLLISLIKVYI